MFFGKGEISCSWRVYSNLFSPKSRLSRALCCLPKVPNTFAFHFFFAASQKSLKGSSKISGSVSFLRHAAERVFFVFLLFFKSSDFSAEGTFAVSGQGLSECSLVWWSSMLKRHTILLQLPHLTGKFAKGDVPEMTFSFLTFSVFPANLQASGKIHFFPEEFKVGMWPSCPHKAHVSLSLSPFDWWMEKWMRAFFNCTFRFSQAPIEHVTCAHCFLPLFCLALLPLCLSTFAASSTSTLTVGAGRLLLWRGFQNSVNVYISVPWKLLCGSNLKMVGGGLFFDDDGIGTFF